MNKIKAFFKNMENYKIEELKKATCLTTISVGQQTHEEDRLSSTFELINNSFYSCILLVDDSLQRHTMALHKKEDAKFFYELSVKEGDLWLERNEKYIKKLTNLKKIIRWDTWLMHPEFKNKLNEIKLTFENDFFYKASFEKSINIFLNKYRGRLTNPNHFDMVRAKQLSLDFVMEECSALCLWPELQCQYEVYPNKHNEAIEETRKRFVLSKYPNLLQAITIEFRNSRQVKPQKFIFLETRS